MSEEERKEEEAVWATIRPLLVKLEEAIDDPEPSRTVREIYAEQTAKWLEVVLSKDVPQAFWEEISIIATSFWRTVEANLEVRDDEPPNILGALEAAERFVGFLSGFAIRLGQLPPEEEEAAEEVEAEVEEETEEK